MTSSAASNATASSDPADCDDPLEQKLTEATEMTGALHFKRGTCNKKAMCGRYAFSASAVQRLARALRAERSAETSLRMSTRLNHAPTQLGPVALRRQGQDVSVETLRWGLVVPWTPAPLINAQSETAAQKPTFRTALEKQRCLIPADAFYEWQDDTKPKQPWEFRLADDEPLVFAGLWHSGTLPNGDRVDAYCILTTQANDTLRRCHDRMPVILRQDDWESWLSPEFQVTSFDSPAPHARLTLRASLRSVCLARRHCARLQAFFKPWPGPMLARPVTTKINKAAYDGPVEEVPLQVPALVQSTPLLPFPTSSALPSGGRDSE